MSKILVAFFSASGITEELARHLCQAVEGDLYEIRPKVPYTTEDLDWTDRNSRSTVEMNDKSCRPPMADANAPVEDADVIFVGYPVWWYREPSIIDTFLEAYDFSGRTIVPFATSGGSEIGAEAPKRMQEICPGARVLPGRKFSHNASIERLKDWVESLGL